ncbi:MCM2/3/5 family-domain-containing protein [Zopfochytrium polystomum]|nr:MCM2/3/5 family-domain-containing protein [Zopfochytrium polystomum]
MAAARRGNGTATSSATFINVNYQMDLERISSFLNKFASSELDDMGEKVIKYKALINEVSERLATSITIDLDDLLIFDNGDDGLVRNIEHNTSRYISLFCDAIDAIMPTNNERPGPDSNPIDVVIYQRQQREIDAEDGVQVFPKSLTRRYTVFFKPRTKHRALTIRDVKGSSLGRLVTIKGMVTRVSTVRPMVKVIAFSCDRCGNENFEDVTKSTYTPLTECGSAICKRNKVKGKLFMQTRSTKFVKFQEIKVQELTDQVPMGHIPRSMTVHLYEDLTRMVSPGDAVHITGIFLPAPYTGFQAIRAGLLTDTYLEGQHIVQLKKHYAQMEITDQIKYEIRKLHEIEDLYGVLSRSIAPEIYGHEDVKKALLLMLVGSPTLQTDDGMKIRGDLNICLMGDPGVAKSQLLKYISKIAPRGVYTTGRGSSGVGLTASVMRDPVTDEMVLEGGALVLADNGIACIDEFDKMDENDRTAIHEVMEQQTISISKAGITTTLNARTSILAAANPQFGRYNTRLRPTENINLPAALLSRFDVLFLILDKPDFEDDIRLATHVTYVHQNNRHMERQGEQNAVDPTILKCYISMARSVAPRLTAKTAGFLVNAYAHLRQREDVSELQYTCARTLLSLIRMATALARLRFSEDVDEGDVEEALRLLEVSKASVNNKVAGKAEDPISAIYRIIREMSSEGRSAGEIAKEVDIPNIRSRITARGFGDDDLQRCIEHYSDANLWMVGRNGQALVWVTADDDDEEEDDSNADPDYARRR